MTDDTGAKRNAVRTVGILNLGYFAIEFAVALTIGSVALFADSIDFLEDASVNFLILIALGWSAMRRAQIGMVLALFLLVPAIATLWTAWSNFSIGIVPSPIPLSLAGLGALAVNSICAILLARFQTARDSLMRAAYLSARNDVLANMAIIGASGLTAVTLSPWPDLITGLGIALMNAGAAREVFDAARNEHAEAQP